MKRLIGRTDVEDGLARLDMLTKEENLMAAARNLEVTNRVDDKVTTIKDVVHDVDGDVKATQELTQRIHDNVTMTKHGAHHSFDVFVHIVTHQRTPYVETAIDKQQRSSLLPHVSDTDFHG